MFYKVWRIIYFFSFSSCMTRIKNEIEIKLCNCTMFKLSKGKYVLWQMFKGLYTLILKMYTNTISGIRIQYSIEGFSNLF